MPKHRRRCKKQIDYIAIKKQYQNAIQQSKEYPGADCAIDQNLPFAK
jgi:hypothetical protein